MISEELTISSVAERDIDLLLVEELRCSRRFQRYLMDRVGLTWDDKCQIFVRHSVCSSGDGAGENDLVVKVLSTQYTAVLLIEDKISAAYTPQQPSRYRRRAALAVECKECDVARTVLVAPQAYAAPSATDFDHVIFHEQIRDYFTSLLDSSDSENRARFEHKIALLDMAIGQQRRGYVATPNQAVSDLWSHYTKLASREFPDLRMVCKDATKPGDSYTVAFDCLCRVEGLPKFRIEHLMQPSKRLDGYVQILLPGFGERIDELSLRFNGLLPDGAVLAPAGKSAALRVDVPLINRFEPAEKQEGKMVEALNVARQLKDWWSKHRQKIAPCLPNTSVDPFPY